MCQAQKEVNGCPNTNIAILHFRKIARGSVFIPIEQGSAIILDRRVAVPTLVVQSCTKRIQTAVVIASVVVTNITIGSWAMIRIGIFDIRVSRFADTLPSNFTNIEGQSCCQRHQMITKFADFSIAVKLLKGGRIANLQSS